MGQRSVVPGLVAAFFLFTTSSAVADLTSAVPSPSPGPTASDEDHAAPNYGSPTAPRPWVSIEDELSPSYDALSGSSNSVILRAQIPIGPNFLLPIMGPRKLQLIRLKLPFVTSAPATAITGNGDTTLVGLEYLGTKHRQWSVGPSFKLPTASSSSLGTGKWSVGPAAGYTYEHESTTIGLYTQSFFSFAGPSSRPPVAQTQLQPSLFFSFPHGWLIGTSQMQFTYNWQSNQWPEIPLGLRIAKNFESAYSRLTATFEVEQNLVHVTGTPGWALRLNFKYQPKTR